MRWFVQIKNSVISKQDLFTDFVAKQKDGEYVLSLEKFRAKRSNAQNSFYHGPVLASIADWMGEFDKESVCKSLKIRLGYCNLTTNKLGMKEWKCPSSKNWNKPEMSDFLFKVEVLMSELTDGQFIFPRPNTENNPY